MFVMGTAALKLSLGTFWKNLENIIFFLWHIQVDYKNYFCV